MPKFFPSFADFERLAGSGNTIPVYCQLLGDNLTPVTAFAAIAGGQPARVPAGERGRRREDRPLLVPGGRSAGDLRGHDATQVTHRRPGRADRRGHQPDPLAELARMLASLSAVHLPELPRFAGGAVGYAGYDMVRYYEPLPNAPKDDRRLPDLLFGLYDTHGRLRPRRKTILVISHAHVELDGVRGGYDKACERMAAMVKRLTRPRQTRTGQIDRLGDPKLPFTSNFEPDGFQKAVEACKEYIRAGDIFQVVLSQRLQRGHHGRPVRHLPGPAGGQPVAVHVLPQEPAGDPGGRLAGDHVPRRGRRHHQPPAGRHAAPRPDRGGGQGPGGRTAGRPQGAGRAHHARGPRPQRRRPRRRAGQRGAAAT